MIYIFKYIYIFRIIHSNMLYIKKLENFLIYKICIVYLFDLNAYYFIITLFLFLHVHEKNRVSIFYHITQKRILYII